MNQAPTPPSKKKGNGCVIALVSLVVITVLACVGLGVVAWKVLSTPEGKQAVRISGGMFHLMEEAKNAPGAKEVGKAGGCQQALVMDMKQWEELMAPDAGSGRRRRTTENRVIITCQVGFIRTPPTCESLARVYVDAAHPKDPFQVIVQKQGQFDKVCSQSFDPDGAPEDAESL